MAVGALLIFVLNILSGVVAFLTSYYAYRFNRLAESPLLRSISAGFMLLGVGLFAEAATSVSLGQTLVDVLASRVLAVIETFTYLTVQMVAYVVFAVGYSYLAFGRSGKAATKVAALAVAPRVVGVVAGLYNFAIVSYFVVLLLLGFIVFQGALIHARASSRFSLLVLSAFALILAAHVVLLASVVALAGVWFLVGDVVQFLGFLTLLVFLLRSGRVGAG
ncbi:MAG: hypothetical protein OK438_08185 [Thaumarchaeota archaeon]|nr:hypothetical protein [Nitrososphaerota archaeon]